MASWELGQRQRPDLFSLMQKLASLGLLQTNNSTGIFSSTLPQPSVLYGSIGQAVGGLGLVACTY